MNTQEIGTHHHHTQKSSLTGKKPKHLKLFHK